MFLGACVCVRERERESEREKEIERKRERESVCVCAGGIMCRQIYYTNFIFLFAPGLTHKCKTRLLLTATYEQSSLQLKKVK